ncbi:hypothetical protein Pan153_47520 [Gimesia panareensis]|uniref:Uncharacterized protein n=1 Tax=Gimesia panareensis TaxID=2527978 RepID=A0A518FUQ7_9PLAN|nr:hypothetical protein [Gimesia panareensis]QDV20081.1 hypothetical protein Pan153_47520 [Gimesia panareensis]
MSDFQSDMNTAEPASANTVLKSINWKWVIALCIAGGGCILGSILTINSLKAGEKELEGKLSSIRMGELAKPSHEVPVQYRNVPRGSRVLIPLVPKIRTNSKQTIELANKLEDTQSMIFVFQFGKPLGYLILAGAVIVLAQGLLRGPLNKKNNQSI